VTKKLYRGTVVPGRKLTQATVERHRDELRRLTREQFFPGSLNIALMTPVRLSCESTLAFDFGRRFVWPARLNGVGVWLYRWPTAPLSVVEVLSSTHLRKGLGLTDGASVTIEVEEAHIAPIGASALLGWVLLWLGRPALFYRSERYRRHARTTGIYLGVTQCRGEMTHMAFLRHLGGAFRRFAGRIATGYRDRSV
jgi:hypothetical protein